MKLIDLPVSAKWLNRCYDAGLAKDIDNEN